jgi:hypothetical protein
MGKTLVRRGLGVLSCGELVVQGKQSLRTIQGKAAVVDDGIRLSSEAGGGTVKVEGM